MQRYKIKHKNLYKYNIEAVILTGENIGSTVFILWITSNTEKNSSFSFTLYRKQFPIRLAFAITFNKSQVQDFENLGLYIHKPLFSHWELYIALSRGKNPKKIFIQNSLEDQSSLKNIVCDEVLD